MDPVLVAASSIASSLNIDLSDNAKMTELQMDIDALVEEMEDELNSYLYRRQVVISAEAVSVGPWQNGRILLRGPIVSVDSVSRDIDAADISWTTSDGTTWPIGAARDSIWVPYYPASTQYTITMTVGPLNPNLKVAKIIRDTITRQRIVGRAVATGAQGNFSVEGVSMSYGAAAAKSDPNAKGSFSASELRSVSSLRRRIVI